MTPLFLLAAALGATTSPITDLGTPVADADLALTSSGVSSGTIMFAARGPVGVLPLGLDRAPIGDEIDCWWASDGAALIAEAVEPVPAVPPLLDMGALTLGEHGFRIDVTITDSFRS